MSPLLYLTRPAPPDAPRRAVWAWRLECCRRHLGFRLSLPGDRYYCAVAMADAEVVAVRRDGLLLRMSAREGSGWQAVWFARWHEWGTFVPA